MSLPLGRMVAICRKHGVTLERVRGPQTLKPVRLARHECYSLLVECGWTTQDIARQFGRTTSAVRHVLTEYHKTPEKRRYLREYYRSLSTWRRLPNTGRPGMSCTD